MNTSTVVSICWLFDFHAIINFNILNSYNETSHHITLALCLKHNQYIHWMDAFSAILNINSNRIVFWFSKSKQRIEIIIFRNDRSQTHTHTHINSEYRISAKYSKWVHIWFHFACGSSDLVCYSSPIAPFPFVQRSHMMCGLDARRCFYLFFCISRLCSLKGCRLSEPSCCGPASHWATFNFFRRISYSPKWQHQIKCKNEIIQPNSLKRTNLFLMGFFFHPCIKRSGFHHSDWLISKNRLFYLETMKYFKSLKNMYVSDMLNMCSGIQCVYIHSLQTLRYKIHKLTLDSERTKPSVHKIRTQSLSWVYSGFGFFFFMPK